MMMKLWLVLIVCTASSISQAQAVSLEVDGERGKWFPDKMARRILADVEELPLLRKKIELLEVDLQISNESIQRLKILNGAEAQHSDSAYKSAETAMLAYSDAIEENEKLRKRKTPVWKHPAIWFTLGAVVAVGLTVGAVQIVQVSE